MNNAFQANAFTDHDLILAMQTIVRKDHESNAQLVALLREVEQRQLHLARGCASLELFCEAVLGLTENQARARVRAMRLTYSVPLAEEKIRAGSLSLSVAALAQHRFNQAERRGIPLGGKDKFQIVERLEHCSLREAERVLAETVGGPAPPREKKQAFAGGVTRVEFTASASLMANIERLQDLLAHKNFDGRLDLLLEYVTEIALTELEKKNFQEPIEAAGIAAAAAKTENISRHIPEQTRRAVWIRDAGICQFRDKDTGRICGSRRWVQMDHIVEFSKGGGHGAANLRLLCGAHNRFVFQENLRADEERERTLKAAAAKRGPELKVAPGA